MAVTSKTKQMKQPFNMSDEEAISGFKGHAEDNDD